MLVITRKIDGKAYLRMNGVLLGSISVCRIKDGAVRLGFDMIDEVKITRDEHEQANDAGDSLRSDSEGNGR